MPEKTKIHKIIYNISDQLFTWLWRIFLVVFLVVAIFHIKENPIIIVILGLVIIYLLRTIPDGEILILQDNGLIYRKKYWELWNEDTFYDFKDIASISVSGHYKMVFNIIRFLLPPPFHIPRDFNTIELTYKNGESKQIKVFIYKKKLTDLVDLANVLIRKNDDV
jgi:hypothetical protein